MGGEFLKTNTTLLQLNLNENNLGSPGAICIAKGMMENKTLKALDLSLNYIDDEGGQVIKEMLEKNTTLEQLGMSGNEIKDYDLRYDVRQRAPKSGRYALWAAKGPSIEGYEGPVKKIN